MANVVKIEKISETDLNKLVGTDPEMERLVRSCMKTVLRNARNSTVRELKGRVGRGYKYSNGDPRDAYKAVKYAVYKKVFGGNISILNKKRASNTRVVVSSGRSRRSGDIRTQSDRTKQINGYYGSDRGFILRFLNSGTKSRSGRGSISSSAMFEQIGGKKIEDALRELDMLVMQKIKEHSDKL